MKNKNIPEKCIAGMFLFFINRIRVSKHALYTLNINQHVLPPESQYPKNKINVI